MEPWFDRSFGEWYPRLYPHRDAAEAKRAVNTILDWLSPTGILLDLACGGGRHLQELRQRGRSAFGIDRSSALINEANSIDPLRGRLVRGDMRRVPFADGTFAAILSMFTSFGYFGSRAAHTDLMREVARVSAPGGRYVLDYLNAPRVRETLVPESRRQVEGFRIRERRRIASHGDGVAVIKETEVQDGSGSMVERFREEVSLYDREELKAMASEAGWTEVVALGDYDGSPWSGSSDRLLVVLEKTA